MHLVQLLLPLYDNDGRPQPRAHFATVRDELRGRFGGLTAFTRAPAEGLWQEDDAERPMRDDIVVYEVMADALDTGWWSTYRKRLEERFRQEVVVIRVQEVQLL